MSLQRVTTRLMWTTGSLVVVLSALHAAFYLMPGDPVRALFGLRSPGPALIAELRDSFGLDDPYLAQLGRYLRGLVTLDLGPVYRIAPGGLALTSTSVGDLVRAAMPSTVALIGTAMAIQALLGSVLGVALAQASGRRLLAFRALVAGLVAVPSFALASLLEINAPGLSGVANLVGAACCMAALPAGLVALVGYPLIKDARGSQFVRRATASGVPAGRIRWLHALRPTLGTMWALAAAEVGNLLTAAVLVEPILGRTGIGSVLVASVNNRQGPTTLAVVGICLILVASVNLLADTATTLLDPRIDAI